MPLIIAAFYLLSIAVLGFIGSFFFPDYNVEAKEQFFTVYDDAAYWNNISEISNLAPVSEQEIEESEYMIKRNSDIQILYNYLHRQNPAVFNMQVVEIIIDASYKEGVDFRIVAAIMGKESGYCIAPYKAYNCYGYLNKVQYSSFEEAFYELTPKVARYVSIYSWDTFALGRAYGAVAWEDWGAWVYAVANKIN